MIPRSPSSRDHRGHTLDTINGFDVIACEACGFVHVLPLPTEAELRQLYAETYYTETKPKYITEYEEDRAWWDMVYAERLSLAESWVAPRESGERFVLDVGSGPGGFLRVAEARGWRPIGIEPSQACRDYCVGLAVGDATLMELDPGASPFMLGAREVFEMIHASEVLEHMPDPRAALARMYDLLTPGGVACIVVPNDYNNLQIALRVHENRNPWWIAPPHHLNYFTPRSLYNLVRSVGFSPADLLTTFPMEFFLFAGMDYVNNPDVGREAHALRKRFEINMELHGLGLVRRQIYRAAAQVGLGRDIVLFARKSEKG